MISLPKLTLQPLVENALYHGVKEKRGQSKITITFDDAGDDIIIQVLDDGIGMKEERLQEVKEGLKQNNNVGFGLAAVQDGLFYILVPDMVLISGRNMVKERGFV